MSILARQVEPLPQGQIVRRSSPAGGSRSLSASWPRLAPGTTATTRPRSPRRSLTWKITTRRSSLLPNQSKIPTTVRDNLYLSATRIDRPGACARVLLVGESNPISSDARYALYHEPHGCAGYLLQRLVLGVHAR